MAFEEKNGSVSKHKVLFEREPDSGTKKKDIAQKMTQPSKFFSPYAGDIRNPDNFYNKLGYDNQSDPYRTGILNQSIDKGKSEQEKYDEFEKLFVNSDYILSGARNPNEYLHFEVNKKGTSNEIERFNEIISALGRKGIHPPQSWLNAYLNQYQNKYSLSGNKESLKYPKSGIQNQEQEEEDEQEEEPIRKNKSMLAWGLDNPISRGMFKGISTVANSLGKAASIVEAGPILGTLMLGRELIRPLDPVFKGQSESKNNVPAMMDKGLGIAGKMGSMAKKMGGFMKK